MDALQLYKLIKNDPVVVTGMGAICAAGDSVEELWNAVIHQRISTSISPFKFENKLLEIPVYRIKSNNIDNELVKKSSKWDRCVKLGIFATRQCLSESGISLESQIKNTGVISGTSRGAVEQLSKLFSYRDLDRILPSFSSNTSVGALSGAIAKTFGFQGTSMTISANCASSAIAIAISCQQIILGLVDSVITGGAEAPLSPPILASMANAGILSIKKKESRTACKPFDINRHGTILGEGAGSIYLEKRSAAMKRNAKIHGEIAGFAYGITPGSSMGVDETGKMLALLIEKALDMAEISPKDISFISLHGTGTKANDTSESRAVWSVFGRSNPDVPVFSIKPITGHCLGASPALESIICIKAINERLIPATANCESKDPECQVNVVMRKPLKIENPRYGLMVASGFWGYKAVLIFKKI